MQKKSVRFFLNKEDDNGSVGKIYAQEKEGRQKGKLTIRGLVNNTIKTRD